MLPGVREGASEKEFTQFATNFNKAFAKFVHFTASFGGLRQRRDHRRLCMAPATSEQP
jgi:hypothetical protein